VSGDLLRLRFGCWPIRSWFAWNTCAAHFFAECEHFFLVSDGAASSSEDDDVLSKASKEFPLNIVSSPEQ
jgi:hypothetical protein